MSKITTTSSIWTREHVEVDIIDMHFDFEFLDLGSAGVPIISLGAVIETDTYIENFYGLNSEFFKSEHMRTLLAAYYDKKHKIHENSTWLFEHVFKHVCFDVDSNLGDFVKSSKANDLALLSRYGLPSLIVDGIDGGLGAWNKLNVALQKDDSEREFGDQREVCSVTTGPVETISRDLITTIKRVAKRSELSEFVVRPIGYHTSTDFSLLCNMFGNIMNLPKFFLNYAIDIRALTDAYGFDHKDYDLDNPHHALLDARAQRASFYDIKSALEIETNKGSNELLHSILGLPE